MNKQIKAGADIHAGDGGYSEGTQEQYDAFVKVRNKSLAQGRIKELAEQAGLEFDNDLALEPEPIYYTTQKDLEKFAELIVQECIGVADHSNVTGKSIIGERIKQHFGVELDVNETLRNRSTYFGNDI